MVLITFFVFSQIKEHVKLWVVSLNFLLLKRKGWTENTNLKVRMNGNWNHKIIQRNRKLKSEHNRPYWDPVGFGVGTPGVTTKRTYGLNHSNYYSRLVSITETMLTLPLAVSAATWPLPSRISSLPLNSGSQNFNGSTSHLYPLSRHKGWPLQCFSRMLTLSSPMSFSVSSETSHRAWYRVA